MVPKNREEKMAPKKTKTKKKAKIAKQNKGREFEKLITRIEKLLSPEGATIKSPDFIPDKVTGELREVDASIRYQIGSAPMLITIECRNRQPKQDITWLEQIKSKRDSVKANQTIVVSKKGFYEPAKKYALHENIILRQIEDVTDELILQCAKNTSVIVRQIIPDQQLEHSLAFYRDDTDPPNIKFSLTKPITFEEPFALDQSGKPLSLRVVLDEFCRAVTSQHWSDTKEHVEQGKSIVLKTTLEKGMLFAETNLGIRSIQGIKIRGRFNLKEIEMPPLKALQYSDANSSPIDFFYETSHEEVGTITAQIKWKNKNA